MRVRNAGGFQRSRKRRSSIITASRCGLLRNRASQGHQEYIGIIEILRDYTEVMGVLVWDNHSLLETSR